MTYTRLQRMEFKWNIYKKENVSLEDNWIRRDWNTYRFYADQSLGLSKSQPYVVPIYSYKSEYQMCRQSAAGNTLSLLRHAKHSDQHHGMPIGTFKVI